MRRFRRLVLPALLCGALALLQVGCEPEPEDCWEQTGQLAQVTTDTVTVHHLDPALSPDGTRILFTTDAFQDLDGDDTRDFALIDVPVPGEVRSPVAMVLDVGNCKRIEIAALADERGIVEAVPNRFQGQPAWHPDGNRFAGTVVGEGLLVRLYIFTLDWASATSTSVPVSDYRLIDDVSLGADPLLNQYNYESPAFSPDGNWLLYARNFYRAEDDAFPLISQPQAIYALNVPDYLAGTRTIVRVTPTGSLVTHPSWAPEGTRIAFEANYSGQREVYTIAFTPASPTPTATARRLTNTVRDPGDPIPVQSFQPTWLRSGLIAFTSTRRPPCTSQRERNVWVMDADGNDQRVLFRTRLDDHFPAFDPSGGNTLVFATKDNPVEDFAGSKTDLYVLRGF